MGFIPAGATLTELPQDDRELFSLIPSLDDQESPTLEQSYTNRASVPPGSSSRSSRVGGTMATNQLAAPPEGSDLKSVPGAPGYPLVGTTFQLMWNPWKLTTR